jgi:hypothetical protein
MSRQSDESDPVFNFTYLPTRWLLGCGVIALVCMLAGLAAMLTLYEKGQPLDALAYWIMAGTWSPLLLVGLTVVVGVYERTHASCRRQSNTAGRVIGKQ